MLWQARDALLDTLPQMGSINLPSVHKHFVLHASLIFKKLEPAVAARADLSTLQLRRERILEWQSDNSIKWN